MKSNKVTASWNYQGYKKNSSGSEFQTTSTSGTINIVFTDNSVTANINGLLNTGDCVYNFSKGWGYCYFKSIKPAYETSLKYNNVGTNEYIALSNFRINDGTIPVKATTTYNLFPVDMKTTPGVKMEDSKYLMFVGETVAECLSNNHGACENIK